MSGGLRLLGGRGVVLVTGREIFDCCFCLQHSARETTKFCCSHEERSFFVALVPGPGHWAVHLCDPFQCPPPQN